MITIILSVPLGRTRCRWEDNIKMDLKEIGIDTRNWVDSAQDSDSWRAVVGLGDVGVMCSPRDSRFTGLNLIEINGLIL